MKKLLISFFLLSLAQFTIGQVKVKLNAECDNDVNFHYLIAFNVVSKEKVISERAREMIVFLDEKAFSEENLKTLFTHLSKKYPYPNNLTVRVETDWENVPNPDNCEGFGTSGESDKENIDDFHWALFLRRGKDEIFRYNPILKDTTIKTIVLKGISF